MHDEQLGARLAPQLAAAGWNVFRVLIMVRRRPPDRPPEPGAGAEVSRELGAAALAAFRREQPFGWQDEAVRQLAEMDDRYTRVLAARDFASPPDDPACACRLYTHDGLGQVDEVGTLEARRRRGHARAAVAAAADAAQRRRLRAGVHGHRRRGLAPGALPPPRLRRDRRHVRVPEAADQLAAIIVSCGPSALHSPGRPHRRGAHARVHERRGARRTRETGEMWFWSRSRNELWHKGETSGNVQTAQGAALRLRRGRDPRAGRAGRPGLPHRRAHLLPQRRARPGAGRGAGGARAHDRGAPRGRHATRGACWPIPSWWARRSRRRPRRWCARRARSPTSALSEEAADVLYHLAVLLAGARTASWPTPTRC